MLTALDRLNTSNLDQVVLSCCVQIPSATVLGWIVQLAGYTHALWLTAAILVFGGAWGALRLNPEATRLRFAGDLARLPVLAPMATL